MTIQKRTCMTCGKPAKKNYVTIAVDDEQHFICETCQTANREAMLKDPNHPAWQYYNMVLTALTGGLRRGQTDD